MASPPTGLTYRRGAVYIVNFPLPDNSQTLEKFALCLQGGALLSNRDRFTAALLTTKGLDRRYAWEVLVSAAESGTDLGVRVLLGELHVIMKDWVKRYAYDLRPETMREVDKALVVSLSLV